jgi:ankyrin repeat protein
LLVIEKGADVNCRENHGKTPLYIACEEGRENWVHTLLYYGADPNIPSHEGIIPLAAISL